MRANIVLFLTAACVVSLAHAQTAPSQKLVRSPEVTHTGKAPTGYTVMFRYSNLKAKTVRIVGEWYFARPSGLSRIAGSPEHLAVEGQGILPMDWQPGDFPLIKFDPEFPDSSGGNWPTVDMAKGSDGTWTYTTPLPSGVFTYGFIVDCIDPHPAATRASTTKCKTISDPSNRPWNETKDGVSEGSVQPLSEVFVPSDANFNTIDYSWQGPATRQGKLTHTTYPSPGHDAYVRYPLPGYVAPNDVNYLVVYTPPNYDPARAKPYLTLYLNPGYGGGDEMNWSTEAAANNILDNLIDTGQIEPMVVVMPDEMGFSDDNYDEAHDQDVINNLIPWVEKHYHVSTSPVDRAIAGIGGTLTNSFILKHPDVFQYYGTLVAGLPKENGTLTPSQIAALKGKSIWIGCGWEDPSFARFTLTSTGAAREVSTFANAGIPVAMDFVYGGHEYYSYRFLLRDFLTRTAFQPTPYATW